MLSVFVSLVSLSFEDMNSSEKWSGSTSSSLTNKYPLKRLKVAIQNNVDIAIPMYIQQLQEHSARLHKYRQTKNWNLLQREQIQASATVRQLKNALEELNSLKSQVIPSDLTSLEEIIKPTQLRVSEAIENFANMNGNLSEPVLDLDVVATDGEALNQSQTQAKANLELASDIEDKKEILQSWEDLQKDIIDLNSVFQTTAKIVHEQGETVNSIENNIAITEDHVRQGTVQLSKAAALKAASVPIAGALIGGMLGGPVGMYCGAKVGAAVMALGGMTGFFGVKAAQRLTRCGNEIEMQSIEEKKTE